MSVKVDKENLTKEQVANWQNAVKEYELIQEANVQNSFKLMTPKEKKSYKEIHGCFTDKDILNNLRSLNYILNVSVTSDNSILFTRLLNGRRPLIYAPPCSFSAPWYAIIEENQEWEIYTEAKTIEDFIDKQDSDSGLVIEGSGWKLKEQQSSHSATITYFGWEKLGFEWKLEKHLIPANETKSLIVSWHNPKLKRITTLEQLRKEQLWHVRKSYEKIKMLLDESFAEEKKKSYIKKHGQLFALALFNNEYAEGQTLLKKRRKLKQSDYPTENEIIIEADKKVHTYLESSYSVNENGELLKWIWKLSKIQPTNITKDIYM